MFLTLHLPVIWACFDPFCVREGLGATFALFDGHYTVLSAESPIGSKINGWDSVSLVLGHLKTEIMSLAWGSFGWVQGNPMWNLDFWICTWDGKTTSFPEGWPSNSHLLTARPFISKTSLPFVKKYLRPSPAQSALSQSSQLDVSTIMHIETLLFIDGYPAIPSCPHSFWSPSDFQDFGACFQDSFWWVKVIWDKAPESVVLALAMLRDFKITPSRLSTWGTNLHCNLGFWAQWQTSSLPSKLTWKL